MTAGDSFIELRIRLSRDSPGPAMNEVTRILSGLQQGDRRAAAELLPLVYDELRKLAARRPQLILTSRIKLLAEQLRHGFLGTIDIIDVQPQLFTDLCWRQILYDVHLECLKGFC